MAPEIMFSTECMSQLSITDSKVKWPLRFAFSYALQTKNNRRSSSAINPVTTENTFTNVETIKLPCIDTLGCQQKEMGHKGGQRQVHNVCIVHTAKCLKELVALKRHQTVKNQACSLSRYRVTLV